VSNIYSGIRITWRLTKFQNSWGTTLNLDTLDTIIAVVVVSLVLSLIVQSIQSFIKKLLKIKSGTILSSLEDEVGRADFIVCGCNFS